MISGSDIIAVAFLTDAGSFFLLLAGLGFSY